MTKRKFTHVSRYHQEYWNDCTRTQSNLIRTKNNGIYLENINTSIKFLIRIQDDIGSVDTSLPINFHSSSERCSKNQWFSSREIYNVTCVTVRCIEFIFLIVIYVRDVIRMAVYIPLARWQKWNRNHTELFPDSLFVCWVGSVMNKQGAWIITDKERFIEVILTDYTYSICVSRHCTHWPKRSTNIFNHYVFLLDLTYIMRNI